MFHIAYIKIILINIHKRSLPNCYETFITVMKMKMHPHKSINLYQNRVKRPSYENKMQLLKKIKIFSFFYEYLQTLSGTGFRASVILPFKNCVMKMLISKQKLHFLKHISQSNGSKSIH